MTKSFNPDAISEVDCLCLMIEYVLYEDATVRSLAEDYAIGSSTVGKYLKETNVFDNRLADLVSHKAKSRYWGANLPKFRRKLPLPKAPFKLKPALYNQLLEKYNQLRTMAVLPANIEKFLWEGYYKTK